MKNQVKNQFVLTEDSNIIETVGHYPAAAEVFARHGLPCLGCAAAHFEKLSDIAGEFGLTAQDLVNEIKKESEKKK